MTKHKPPYIMVIIDMTKPYGILFLQKPTRNQVLETLANLLTEGSDKELDDCFRITEFDISEDVQGSLSE